LEADAALRCVGRWLQFLVQIDQGDIVFEKVLSISARRIENDSIGSDMFTQSTKVRTTKTLM